MGSRPRKVAGGVRGDGYSGVAAAVDVGGEVRLRIRGVVRANPLAGYARGPERDRPRRHALDPLATTPAGELRSLGAQSDAAVRSGGVSDAGARRQGDPGSSIERLDFAGCLRNHGTADRTLAHAATAVSGGD